MDGLSLFEHEACKAGDSNTLSQFQRALLSFRLDYQETQSGVGQKINSGFEPVSHNGRDFSCQVNLVLIGWDRE